MFQSYEDATHSHGSARLSQLRNAMKKAGVEAYLVPRADEHQGEYVPTNAERLYWLTSFTGSAGTAVAALKKAALFVDGRYTVQAKMQVDTNAYEIHQQPPLNMMDWLADTLKPGNSLGCDPRLMTIANARRLRQQLDDAGIKLKSVSTNLVDKVWGDERPKAPSAPIIEQPLKFAGQSATEKIKHVQNTLKEAGGDALLLTLPDSIAWLLNMRGTDVAHNPVALGFAIVPVRGKVTAFFDPGRLSAPLKKTLASRVTFEKPASLSKTCSALKAASKKVQLDPASTSLWFQQKLGKANIIEAADPCIMLKAIKNPVEIAGARSAHIRDGVAMVQFLTWLEAAVSDPKNTVTEISAATQLEQCRRQTNELLEISFDTISGAGPNGAIVHYRVTEPTNRPLQNGELYLVDSGGQYRDGTTDITRTLAIGKPSKEMCQRFTRVLKGHIAIATARFPEGTRGIDIDAFARRSLWDAGLDYDHGTGHGVGSYLSVHEGPQGIHRRSMVKLEPGMILSNEPGYYKEGAYGIRIENLELVREPEVPKGGDRAMLGFEALTLCPIDLNLVDTKLMTPAEVNWLNSYHKRVWSELSPLLEKTERSWLKQATRAV